MMDTSCAASIKDFRFTGAWFCILNIVHDRVVEEDSILRHYTDMVTQTLYGNAANIDVIN